MRADIAILNNRIAEPALPAASAILIYDCTGEPPLSEAERLPCIVFQANP